MSSSFDNSNIAVVALLKGPNATDPHNMIDGEVSIQPILDIFVFNSSLVNAIRVSYKEPFTAVNKYSPHSGPIRAIAVCPTKSVIASLSGDKTFKFWNYSASEKQIFSTDFNIHEECFDLHPLLVQCAVGFKEGIRIFFILENELPIAYESYTKSCKAIKYSESGHLLAVGFDQQVHIVSPYRLKTVKVIQDAQPGHVV